MALGYNPNCGEKAMIFEWLKAGRRCKAAAERLYQSALAQSRRAEFYKELGVADTMDGRFDLLCLHSAILITRLNREGAAGQRLAQALFDVLFTQMDYGLREIGVGDLGVPKHMQKMMKAFNGRMQAYAAALDSRDRNAMAQALARNLYRRENADAAAHSMADYAIAARDAAMDATMQNMAEGIFEYPAPPEFLKERTASHA